MISACNEFSIQRSLSAVLAVIAQSEEHPTRNRKIWVQVPLTAQTSKDVYGEYNRIENHEMTLPTVVVSRTPGDTIENRPLGMYL